MGEIEKVQEGLRPLFERAEREGLWFYSTYQDLWFSPKELKDQQAKGAFNWGAVNWMLRNPRERLAILRIAVINAKKELGDWEKRAGLETGADTAAEGRA